MSESTPSFDVICCGNSAYDHIWHVDTLPAGDGKSRALDYVERIGGLAANAAIAVARLGAKAALWSRAGEDETGRKMVSQVAARGVDVQYFRLTEGAQSPHASVIVEKSGARSIVAYRGGGWAETANWLPFEWVAAAQAVHADTRWPLGAAATFNAARAAHIPSVLDVEITERAILERLLPLTDYAVFSLPGLRAFTPADDLRSGLQTVLEHGARVPVVTLGAEGVMWLEDGAMQRLPAFQVRAVDTTGAGDVFHGALALALGEGMQSLQALRFASATAALKCTRFGGGAGTPTRDEVDAFLRETTNSA
jgi:sulfofructose kinase